MYKALVISDDTAINPTLDAAARRMGCQLCIKTNPAAAIDAIGNIMPALILIDFCLPDEDGYVWNYSALNTCRAVRGIYSEAFPILILSHDRSPAARHACMAAGADDVLDKSHDTATLARRLSFWLRLADVRHDRLNEEPLPDGGLGFDPTGLEPRFNGGPRGLSGTRLPSVAYHYS